MTGLWLNSCRWVVGLGLCLAAPATPAEAVQDGEIIAFRADYRLSLQGNVSC